MEITKKLLNKRILYRESWGSATTKHEAIIREVTKKSVRIEYFRGDRTTVHVWESKDDMHIIEVLPPLPDNGKERWEKERASAIQMAREACKEFGFDNSWTDDLHLGDVIEKRLMNQWVELRKELE